MRQKRVRALAPEGRLAWPLDLIRASLGRWKRTRHHFRYAASHAGVDLRDGTRQYGQSNAVAVQDAGRALDSTFATVELFPALLVLRRASILTPIADRDRGLDCNIRRRILSNRFSAAVLLLITTSYPLTVHA